MNPIDQLKNDLLNSGKQVISVRYILDRLASIERHDCPNCEMIPVYDMATFGRGLQDVKGGEENRTLSKVD